jgi:hypothetical protein
MEPKMPIDKSPIRLFVDFGLEREDGGSLKDFSVGMTIGSDVHFNIHISLEIKSIIGLK